MAAASRIAVELVGEPQSLKAAVATAADSLKGLGDVLKRETTLAASLSDQTIRMNADVAKSFEAAASKAGVASKETISSLERQGAVALQKADEQVAASDRVVLALEKEAEAAKLTADQSVRANDLAAAAAAQKAQKDEAASRRSSQAFGAQNAAITKAGRTMTLSLLAVAAGSVDLAVKFQANTLRMQTQAGATTAQLAKLRKGILDMAGAVGYTPNQLADGMYHVVSSMNAVLPPTQRVVGELRILREAANLARVGHSDLAETTYALASAMNALHEPISKTSQVAGQLNAIVGSGDMTMTDLVDALKSGLLPTAHETGLSLQSVGAALAVMGDQGMRGALAGTRLRMSIALLSSPSEKAAKELEAIGLSSHDAIARTDAMSSMLQKAGLRTTQLAADLRQPNGLSVALQDLNNHLRASGVTASGAAALMSSAFGGGRMGATITLLAQSTDRLNSKFGQIGQTANQFGVDTKKALGTTAGELQQARAEFEALGVSLGTTLLPVVNTALRDLMGFVDWLKRGGMAAHALEAVIGTLALVTIGSYFVSKVNQAIKLAKDLRSAFTFGGVLMQTGSVAAAKTAAAPLGGMGAGMISGSRGFTAPGSTANPIVVVIEAGQYAGLGSMGAAGTVGTEEKVAQAESGAVNAERSAGGVILPGGVGGAAATERAALTAAPAEVATEGGLLAMLKGGGLAKALGPLAAAGVGMTVGPMAQGALGLRGGGAASAAGGVGGAAVGAGIGAAIATPLDAISGPLGTMLGAGIGSTLGSALGPTIGHALDSVFGSGKGYGTKVSRAFLAPINAQLPDTGGKLHDMLYKAANSFNEALKAAKPTDYFGRIIQPTKADEAKVKSTAFNFGWTAGQETVLGLKSVKAPSTFAVTQDFLGRLKALPEQARPEAARVMLLYAQQLQASGQLPKGAVASMISQIEGQFPALRVSLKASAMGTASDVAQAMHMQQAQDAVKTTLQSMKQEFGLLSIDPDATGQKLLSNISSAYSQIHQVIKSSVGQAKTDAIAQASQLRSQWGTLLAATLTHTEATMSSITTAIASGSQQATQQAGSNLNNLIGQYATAMQAGVENTNTGMKDIATGLNATLKAFGAKPIPTPSAVQWAAWAANGAAGGQGANVGGSRIGHRAGGGVVGNWGERGRDTVLTMLGRGEAVLNDTHQGIVNHALATTPFGSLKGVFDATRGSVHGMAAGGYVDPYTGLLSERLDQGKDFGGAGGVGAIGPASVTEVGLWPGWPGTGGVVYRLTQGPRSGSLVYIMEDFAASVSVGQKLLAGQLVGSATGGPSGIETGWANSSGTGPLTPYNGRPDGTPMPAAIDFWNFVQGLQAGKVIGSSLGPGAAATATAPPIQTPQVTGTGTIATAVQKAFGLATSAANTYASAHGGSGAGASSGTFAGNLSGPVAKQVYEFFSANGFNKIAIAGMLGNAMQESSMNPSTPGGGLWQQISNFGQGAPPLLVQMKTMLPQIVGLRGAMNAASTPGDAATIFEQGFEKAGIPALANRIAAANAAYAAGYAPGGFVGYASGHLPSNVIKAATAHLPGVQKAPKASGTKLTEKDLAALSVLGGEIGRLENDLAQILGGTGSTGSYNSLSTRFSAEEGEPQYLNADGSVNPAGYAKKVADDQQLLALQQQALGGYMKELGLVSPALGKWLGKQAKTDQRIAQNKSKIARNKVEEASIRKAILDLTKPAPNVVQTIEDQIAQLRNKYAPELTKARSEKNAYSGTSLGSENSLKGAVLAAQRKKDAYTGSDANTKRNLAAAVSGAELALRSYQLSEAPTKQQLAQAVTNLTLDEQTALQPLQRALLTAKIAQQRRAARLKSETFGLRERLGTLTKADATMTAQDSSLSSVLTGAGGGQSTNTTVALLETIAQKLGFVEWSGGKFAGIDTTDQGAIFDTNTTIIQLQNDIGTATTDASGAATQSATNQQLVTLLQQQNLQLSETLALNEAQTKALSGFIPEIPSYKEGGPVPSDTLANLHGGEFVVPQGGALVSNATTPNVTIEHHWHGKAGDLAAMMDSRIASPDNAQVISKHFGRRTAMLRAAPGRR